MALPKFRIKAVTTIRKDTTIETHYYPQHLLCNLFWRFPIYDNFPHLEDTDLYYTDIETAKNFIQGQISEKREKIIKTIITYYPYENSNN